MIRVAAVGDVHYDRRRRPELRQMFQSLRSRADLLLIAGDLTQSGAPEEAEAFAQDLESAGVPIALVLGNHDFHSGYEKEIIALFQARGIISLEGDTQVFTINGRSVGLVGLKGFGGGFFGACVTDFGEPESKRFAKHGRAQAEVLKTKLASLRTEYRFVLLHYSPVEGTLLGEKREIYPFLGSYLLAEAIDEIGADAVFHGHAHHGVERGATPLGIPVRNVALPVIRHAFNIYTFEKPRPERHLPEHPTHPSELGFSLG